MAFLGKGKKADLVKLSEFLGIELPDKANVVQIKNEITSHENYEEIFLATLLETIIKERLESEEKEREREMKFNLEKEQIEIKLKLEKEQNEIKLKREEEERNIRLQREQEMFEIEKEEKLKIIQLKEQEMKLKFDLEKAKLDKGIPEASGFRPNIGDLSLHRLIPKFDPVQNDISLYLVIFERQVKKAKIDQELWVNHLIGLMPIDIVQAIARESPEYAEDYTHIKKMLLKKYKLSAETFRQKFTQHQKKPDSSWKEFTFELKNYLEEWLAGMEIVSLEELKDLMIVDQLKKRVKHEMKEHFLDRWPALKSSKEVTELFDSYEDVRRVNNKVHARDFRNEKSHVIKSFGRDRNVPTKSFPPKLNSDPPAARFSDTNKVFEKRVKLRCFHCNSTDHLRPSCPKLIKGQKFESVNNIQSKGPVDFLESYTCTGSVNGKRIEILRDTGATVDLVCRKYINSEDFCGEKVWIKQPLSLELICLPLAIVELQGKFGKIKTKAAVCENHLNENRYILGNRTAALLKGEDDVEFFPMENVNTIQTRSRTERLNKERVEREKLSKSPALGRREKGDVAGIRSPSDALEVPTSRDALFRASDSVQVEPSTEGLSEIPSLEARASENEFSVQIESDTEGQMQIPDLQEGTSELKLLQISKEKFMEAQRKCEDLAELFRQVDDSNSADKTYSISGGLLVKNREDRLGNMTKLLVIPKELREQIKTLCHEGTSAHVGCTKSKDKLIRYFYWPNCYKEMDDFVRSCDSCQKAGKPNDKKKAPLKIVPVIREIFSKLNIDICGPLPKTTDENRYIITAICMSSRYPEAIPVTIINSVTAIDALLNIFSRTGFPHENQYDQGSYFTRGA